MKAFSKIKNVIKQPKLILFHIMNSRLFSVLPDDQYLRFQYRIKCGRKLNLESPKTFNEKLNWIKLYDRNPLYTKLADKYEVKSFVSNLIGDEYVVHNYGVWDQIEDLDYDNLPNQFVLKATHNSGGAVICRDKSNFNMTSVIKKYHRILNRNYFTYSREWPYKNIQPRIIVDQFLDDGTCGDRQISLSDYKFWCFNGVPKYMYITVKDNNVYENFYDMNFSPVYSIDHGFPRNNPEFDKPMNFDKMVELAETLAKASETAFVRVDFFDVNGRIYFGEFTFYDWGGLRPFANEKMDEELGKLIQLPEKDIDNK